SFSRNKQILTNFLKNFLPLPDEITHITLLNPVNKKSNPSKLHSHKTQASNQQLEFKETTLYSQQLDKKHIVLDLRVKLKSGENINVEMQTVFKKHFLKRVLFYWSKLYSHELEKGETYDKINPAYSLIFTTFPVLDDKIKDFMSSFSIRRDRAPYQLFNEDLKIIIVELSKLTKSLNELLDLKEKWCYFLRESDRLTEEEYKYLSKDREIKVALKHFYKLSKDQELYQEALTREISEVAYRLDKAGWLEEGIEKGMEKGMVQGGFNKQKEIALNMLEEKANISFISKVTGLSKPEISKLKNRQN
ncbi:MAG: Rpn family recombination-promoting nuclease/putative transposase, partial [Oligoflexia bacterium]|nr:Rpn family recombination-promoting nuclease/putative transposase [Oligoflexia bacterium]